MTVAILLVALFLLFQLPGLRGRAALRTHRDRAAIAGGIFFVVMGVFHFTRPEQYLAMMPPVLPAPLFLVWASGVAEIACGIGLLFPGTRRRAAWATIALLLAILPANIHVALSGGSVEGMPEAHWYYVIRVPFQLFYIGWAAWAGGLLQRHAPGNASRLSRPRGAS